MKDIDIEENNSCRYEIRYNRIYDYITTHTTLKNTILFIYKVSPLFCCVIIYTAYHYVSKKEGFNSNTSYIL